MKQALAIGILSAFLVLVGSFGFNQWRQNTRNKQLTTQLNQQLMEANLELGKAQSTIGDADKYIVVLEEKLQEEILHNQETIDKYGKIIARLKASGKTKTETVIVSSSKLTDRELIEALMIQLGVSPVQLLGLTLDENSDPVIIAVDYLEGASSDFRLDILARIGPVSTEIMYRIHQRFEGQLISTTGPTGAKNTYLNLWELDNEDNRVEKLSLDSFEVILQDLRRERMFWWAPHLDAGSTIAFRGLKRPSVGGTLGFSTSGWGKTKNDLTWRFMRLGVSLTSEDLILELSPALWNIGSVVPLISNTWMGVNIGSTLDKEYSLGLSLTVGL